MKKFKTQLLHLLGAILVNLQDLNARGDSDRKERQQRMNDIDKIMQDGHEILKQANTPKPFPSGGIKFTEPKSVHSTNTPEEQKRDREKFLKYGDRYGRLGSLVLPGGVEVPALSTLEWLESKGMHKDIVAALTGAMDETIQKLGYIKEESILPGLFTYRKKIVEEKDTFDKDAGKANRDEDINNEDAEEYQGCGWAKKFTKTEVSNPGVTAYIMRLEDQVKSLIIERDATAKVRDEFKAERNDVRNRYDEVVGKYNKVVKQLRDAQEAFDEVVANDKANIGLRDEAWQALANAKDRITKLESEKKEALQKLNRAESVSAKRYSEHEALKASLVWKPNTIIPDVGRTFVTRRKFTSESQPQYAIGRLDHVEKRTDGGVGQMTFSPGLMNNDFQVYGVAWRYVEHAGS